MADSNGKLRILSLNVYDVAGISKDRSDRVATLCQCIADNQDDPSMQYDIIALQEVFCEDTREAVDAAASRGGFGYVRHFISGTAIPFGATGSGCSVLSSLPIVASCFHKFLVNGFPENIHHWDFQAGKGIGLCRLDSGEHKIDFYVTHLIGEYSEGFKDCYRSHRVLQATECAAYINLTARSDSLVCVAGDLNALPHSPELNVLQTFAGLSDAWEATNDEEESPGHTFAAEPNPYSFSRTPPLLVRLIPFLNDTVFSFEHPKRVDFVLFRAPGRSHGCEVVFNKAIGPKNLFVSDHFGVCAVLSLPQDSTFVPDTPGSLRKAKELVRMHAKLATREAKYYQKKHFAWAYLGIGMAAAAYITGCDPTWAVVMALSTVAVFHSALMALMQSNKIRHEHRTMMAFVAQIAVLLLGYTYASWCLGVWQFLGCMTLGMAPAFASTHFLMGLHFCCDLVSSVEIVAQSAHSLVQDSHRESF
eukprot:TRINITY_DN7194_c0_g1_i3.p1 TRINITY_DN7194_c0_g1~~TRINITY_DN7194_c0_g1_i3.p1  ORF type:complete len:476 (-),score=83.09 TRINITY_DN7194_c0_g1_i3:90-1517(-)